MARKPPRLKMVQPQLKAAEFRTCPPPPKKADDFYSSAPWRDLRSAILRERGPTCEKCGAQGGRVYLDHITELRDGGAALDRSNLMILCPSCHTAKTGQARARRLGLA